MIPRGRLVGAGPARGWASPRSDEEVGGCPRSQAGAGPVVGRGSGWQRRNGGVLSRWCCRVGRRVSWGSGWRRRRPVWRGSGRVAVAGADGAGVPARSQRQRQRQRKWRWWWWWWWGAVGAAGRAVRRPGSSRSRSRFGCAGRGGVCRSGGFAERRGCCARPLGVAVLGVCRCGRVHVRCHLLPILRDCVLPTAICQLPIAYCRLGSVGVPGVSFLRVLSDWCVCLVRGTAAGRGDPFRAISLPPVVCPSLRLWTGVRDAIARGAYHASPGLRPARATGEWSRILPAGRVGQRLGLVCLHLLDSCTESISLCVHQLSTTPGTPASPTRLETSHVPTPIRLHPNRNQTRKPPARPRPTAHLSVAARPNPNRTPARPRPPAPATPTPSSPPA